MSAQARAIEVVPDQREKHLTGAVMVCGGGIAGIQSALDLANSGFKVYLVEKSPTIGGKMAQLDKTFPTGDCATCIISPKLVEAARNLNIEIITQAHVDEVSGEPGNFRVRLREKARYVDVNKCSSCGDCEKVCPVRVPDEFNRGLGTKAAIAKVCAQAVPNAFVIEKRERPPCVSACPIGQNVQGYVALIADGKFDEAAALIRRDNPLPLICGYVCHRPCESACQQGRHGDPVSIRMLKRAALDHSSPSPSPVGEGRGEVSALTLSPWGEGRGEGVSSLNSAPGEVAARIAIIGSGPAGLGAAEWLARNNYNVTIFEAMSVPGGMMRAGIPDFRLPREVLDSQIQDILDLGVELKLNAPVGSEITIESLLASGYSAVFAAVGAQKSSSLGLDGEHIDGVIPGIEFIRDVNLGKSVVLGNRVVVIGAGNAAMDIARTAVRLGSKDVTIVYRRTKREMPADPVEVEDAIREGVRFVFLTNPRRFVARNGKLSGVECVKMKLSDERDASGRRRPEPVEGSEHLIACDNAILATGQVTDPEFAAGAQIEFNKWGLVDVNPVTLETSVAGVFAGGDVVAGAGTLSEAVGAGRRAAESIHRFVMGEDMAAGRDADSRVWTEDQHEAFERAYLRDRRERSHAVHADHDAGYSADDAVREASRCLSCGVCCECGECVKACLAKAIDHDMKDSFREVEVGAVILTPGYEEYDARGRGEFGFGRYANVVSNIQFERMLSAGGPFGGHLQRPSDGRDPRKLAFIQCVGSRDHTHGKPYCSSVCCMAAIKEAMLAIEHAPGLEVTIFYQDIRAFGKDFDRYYERAKAMGVKFIRSMISRVVEMPESRNLRLSHILNGAPVDEEFDIVVLSTGIRPSEEALRTAEILGVRLNECGFCGAEPYRPVAASRDGVFVAGAFEEPKDIPETVAQASAAAASAMELLAPARGTLVSEKQYPPERDVIDESPRIGVFICHCGINIASVVDIERVVEAARSLPGVAYAENSVYACADNSQDRIKELILEHKLNRLIIASCTPRTHEPLFRETARECGLNPDLVDMANIRDQCSWVHSDDPEAATLKSVDLVKMAVGRSARLMSLMTEELPVVQTAMVVGGGPSGPTAALSLAEQGFPVHLIEKSGSLGGRMEQGDAREELVAQVGDHPLINVYPNSKAVTLKGHVGNFVAEVQTPGGVKSLSHGALVIAVGGTEHKPAEYLYGQDERVMTQRELAEAMSEGDLYLPANPTVAMIQCVGSRNAERPFCSRSCCIDAVKNAVRLKESNPDAGVVVLYRDMRTYGVSELIYQKARELGVVFVKYDPEQPPVVTPGARLGLSFIDPDLGRTMSLGVDLLVLSTGTSPAVDAQQVSDLAKIPLNTDGFFLEAHLKLRPVDFASEGIFLCGSAHSPKPTSENVQQGKAAAGRAATVLSKKTMTVGGMVSKVDVRKCVSCLTCVKVCPYGAPEVSVANNKNRVEIQAAKCMGCGSCASECPARAIQLQHFMDVQITAAIESLLEGGVVS